MALLVLDTSVVGKWLKEEIYSEISLKIREDFISGVHEIVVPDLILYEIANAMRYDNRFTKELTLNSLDMLINLELDIVIPTEEIMKSAIELAYTYDITIYDAVFISLAKLIDAIFITADRNLYEKIKELKFVKFITGFK